jgi:bacillithiol biosynthesis cysteine-adding enzyme BshC
MMRNLLTTPIYNPLYYDYIQKRPKITKFLPDLLNTNWLDLCEYVSTSSEDIQKKVKQILIKQNSDLTSKAAKRNIDSLRHNNTVLLITGQQIALFASPLYTIYKVITIIKLAEQLNAKMLPFHFVPLFWLESEDDDFREVNHFGIWNQNLNPQIISYQGKDQERAAMRHYKFGDEIQLVISQLRESLLETEFSEKLLSTLEDIYRPGENWIIATRNFLKTIFAATGLLYFHPGDLPIKRLSAIFFQQLLDDSKQIGELFSLRTQEVVREGYSEQVPDIAGKSFIHFENEQLQREHLYRKGKKFYIKSNAAEYSLQQMKDLLHNSPEKFSTSVVSRPLLQSWLFPVVAYIAGPAEISYWTQLGGLFEHLKIPMPLVYPRISATIVEPKIVRYVEKHAPDIENIPVKMQLFIDSYFKNMAHKRAEDPFQDAQQILSDFKTKIGSYLNKLDPTLLQMSAKTFERMQSQIENLENKSIKVREAKEKTLSSHLEQIHQTFFPEGQPQERYISIVYFLNKFGPEIFQELYHGLSYDSFQHQILAVQTGN